MNNPVPFTTNEERDERRHEADLLVRAANLLPLMTRDPELVRYRLAAAGSDSLMLPGPADLTRAAEVLNQVAAVLRDSYRNRVRPDDEPDPWRVTDGSLDGGVPFLNDDQGSVEPGALLTAAVLARQDEAYAQGWRLEPLNDGQEGFRVLGVDGAAITWKVTDDAVVQVTSRPGPLTRAPISVFGPLMAGLIVRAWWHGVRNKG